MTHKFTIPKLVFSKDLSTPFYAFFRFEGVLIRRQYNINTIKDFDNRYKEGVKLAKFLLSKLKGGWNPLITDAYSNKEKYTLSEALHFALEKKQPSISPKTYLGYKSTLGFIVKSIAFLKLDNLDIKNLRRVHIKTIVENIKIQRKATNQSYNKYLDHFRAILSELLQWDILEFNPANKIIYLSLFIKIHQ